jgi:hypothetical protein
MEMEVVLEKIVLLRPVDAVAKNTKDSRDVIPHLVG